ncbi:adenylosuccinate lyase [Thermomicrobiaceae bacterium CFH 74404]|uniref:Adenylosuccinate lyase n=1 Tax=Thermalbibacter longus TaxID=2951981 RepID=A0AA41WDJ9_9BACT|nr:adenylosuccinate lyase [Thermalbibacter longus]MCM8750052.1 adenylosuccinate lyase [Thermalbibacter longus]
MIPRYTRPEMGRIWSEEHKISLWLRVEIAVAEAWATRGVIPPGAMERIRGAKCDLERMRQIEKEVDHDVIAFLRATGESVGEAARFIHLGLTSSDVIDTALALQLVEAADLLVADLDRLIEVVGRRAIEHRRTVMIGRTHGVHAEPITFGFKLAGWYAELKRARERLLAAREEVRVGKISGAVGTHANVPPDLEEEVCQRLGLRADPASTQVVSRDRHAFFVAALAILGSTLDRFATEIRHLQRTEVRELEEPFDPSNMGSSAMPHKRNPHESERISGLARLLRSYVGPALEDIALWHERDISHSSVERVVLPDACILADYLLALMTEIVEGWVVYPERMRQNLDATAGAIFSQQAMLRLVEAGLDRQDAYRIVQRLARQAWETGTHLRELLLADQRVRAHLSPEQIDAIFDLEPHLRYVDETFRRVGLPVSAPEALSA